MAEPDLLERTEQQSAIAAALRAAQQGDGRLLLIEGAAGIGKSRLLHELRHLAAPGTRVLSARASELEQGFAFGVVRQLFEGVVRDPELGPLACAGAGAGAQSIFDEVPGEAGGASFARLHGLHWLTLNLAELSPLVLAIDDLHWCDASSLRFLGYLSRRLEGTAVLLAAATRPVAPSTVDAELVADLVTEPSGLHVYPQALSGAGVQALLVAQLQRPVDPAFADACFDATDGNPLMLRQLGRSLLADETEPVAANAAHVRRAAHRALARTVLARVGRHSPAAIAVARAVAVLGDTSTTPLVATLAELAPSEVAPAWVELVDAEVLRRDRLAFVHALVRDAIYFDLPAPEREQLHARAARVLSEAGESVERVASQLELAPRSGDPWSLDIALQAGRAAARRDAPDAAARHFRRALEEPPTAEQRPEILSLLAQALFDIDAPAAIEVLRELVTLTPDLRPRAEILIAMTQALALTDHWTEAAALGGQMLAELGDAEDMAELAAMFEAIRNVTGIFGSYGETGPPQLTERRTLEPGAALGFRLRAGEAALLWMFDNGTARECVELAQRALADDTQALRDHTLVAVAPVYVLALADEDEGLQLWERTRAESFQTGSTIVNLNALLWLGTVQLRRGDLTGAITGLTEAQRLMTRWGSGQEAQRYAQSALALALLESGDTAGARATLDADAREAQPASSLGSALWWHSHAWVLFAEGHLEEALAATHVLEHRCSWIRRPLGHDYRIPRALILHRTGETEAALAAANEAVAITESWGAPGLLGAALRARGEVRGDAGLDDLIRSVKVLDGSAARIQFVRSLVTLGGALRRARRPTEARVPLERAYELGGACGSPMLVEMARVELAATGVRRRPGEVAGPDALTPSERRVADLAAGGRSNREIAQELFVTPKTVEVHLSASYRKLGISSRHALAGALTA